jgi:hypothetical protein
VLAKRGAITESWWRKGSGGSDLSLRSELYTEDGFRQLVVAIEAMPTFFGSLGEFEDHGERGLVWETSVGTHGAVTEFAWVSSLGTPPWSSANVFSALLSVFAINGHIVNDFNDRPSALLRRTGNNLDLRSLEAPIRELIEPWPKYGVAPKYDGTNRLDRTNAPLIEMSFA